MANMSYCRFQNTLADLRDCERAMNEEDVENLSDAEQKARNKLIRLCIGIAKEYGPDPVSNALYALSLKELEVH